MTSNLITVARKAREIPELKEEIRKGNVSVSKIRKVCPVIDRKNQKQWIQTAKTSTQKELELKVAEVKIDHTPRSSMKAVAKDTVRLSLDIPEECREKVDRLQELLSSKLGVDCSLQEVLDFALEVALDKQDPVRKAERAELRKQTKAKKEQETPSSPQERRVCRKTYATRGRKSLAKNLVHDIQRRDQGRCTYVSLDGKRCGAKRWLHYHHVLGVARGGMDILDNLTTLCSAHHRLIHHKRDPEDLGVLNKE
jgi:5-methylcytosine-specific restriction endonuclease McrA